MAMSVKRGTNVLGHSRFRTAIRKTESTAALSGEPPSFDPGTMLDNVLRTVVRNAVWTCGPYYAAITLTKGGHEYRHQHRPGGKSRWQVTIDCFRQPIVISDRRQRP
jgi:hypothetical protein